MAGDRPMPRNQPTNLSLKPQLSNASDEGDDADSRNPNEGPQPKYEGPSTDANGRYIRRRRASSTFSQKPRMMVGSAPPPRTGAKFDNPLPRLNIKDPETVNHPLVNPDDGPPEKVDIGEIKACFTHRPGFVRKIEGKWARPEYQEQFKHYPSATGFPGPLGHRVKGVDWTDKSVQDASTYSTVQSSLLFGHHSRAGTGSGDAEGQGKDSQIPPTMWFSTYFEKDLSRYGPVCPSITYYGKQKCRWVIEAELRAHLLSKPGVRKIQRRRIQNDTARAAVEEDVVADYKASRKEADLRVDRWTFTPGDANAQPTPRHRNKERAVAPRTMAQETADSIELQDMARPRNSTAQGPRPEPRRGDRHPEARALLRPLEHQIDRISPQSTRFAAESTSNTKNTLQDQAPKRHAHTGRRQPTLGNSQTREGHPGPPVSPRNHQRKIVSQSEAKKTFPHAHASRGPPPPVHGPSVSPRAPTHASQPTARNHIQTRSPRPLPHASPRSTYSSIPDQSSSPRLPAPRFGGQMELRSSNPWRRTDRSTTQSAVSSHQPSIMNTATSVSQVSGNGTNPSSLDIQTDPVSVSGQEASRWGQPAVGSEASQQLNGGERAEDPFRDDVETQVITMLDPPKQELGSDKIPSIKIDELAPEPEAG